VVSHILIGTDDPLESHTMTSWCCYEVHSIISYDGEASIENDWSLNHFNSCHSKTNMLSLQWRSWAWALALDVDPEIVRHSHSLAVHNCDLLISIFHQYALGDHGSSIHSSSQMECYKNSIDDRSMKVGGSHDRWIRFAMGHHQWITTPEDTPFFGSWMGWLPSCSHRDCGSYCSVPARLSEDNIV
jgi:hypothetical protein